MDDIKWPREYLVWDLETSGLEKESCKILEIGWMRVTWGGSGECGSVILKHDIKIPAEITALTGISNELMEEEGVEPTKAIADFVTMLGECAAHVTHNGMRFDIEWIAWHAAKALGWTVGKHRAFLERTRRSAIDTAVIVKAQKLGMPRMWNESFCDFSDRIMGIFAKGVKYSVGASCEHLEIDTSSTRTHRAAGDVKLTNLIYRRLLEKHGKQD